MIITTTIGVSIISVLLTAAGMLAAFCYKNGSTNNELKNVKEQQLMIKADLEKDIASIEDKKADKDVVQMIFAEITSIKDILNSMINREIEKKDK